METKYENIIAIRETTDGKDADKYLQAGWKLLETVGMSFSESESYYVLYSFGWPKEKGEPKEIPEQYSGYKKL